MTADLKKNGAQSLPLEQPAEARSTRRTALKTALSVGCAATAIPTMAQTGETSIDLLHLAQRCITTEPQNMLLAGRCVANNGTYTIYPNPDDKDFAMTVRIGDVVEGPIAVTVENPLDTLVSVRMQALKVRKGCLLCVRHRGEERQVELRPEQGREMLIAMASPPSGGSCCRVLAEFDCDTGSYLGWCFGWWNCLRGDC